MTRLTCGWIVGVLAACGPSAGWESAGASGSAGEGTGSGSGGSSRSTGSGGHDGDGDGDSVSGSDDDGPVDGGCVWSVQTLIEGTDDPSPFLGQVSSWGDGLVLSHGGVPHEISAYDLLGAHRWTRAIDGLELVRDSFSGDDGTTVVTGDITGGAGVWLGVLEPSGDVRWSTSFDDGGGLWADGYVVPVEDDLLVAYENEVDVVVSRRDARGAELWTVSTPRPVGPTGQHHTIAAMPDGSVLQLHRGEGTALRHRSGSDGSVLAEGSLDLLAMDLAVLPDGTVFVVGNDSNDVALLVEVEVDGTRVATQTFEQQELLWVEWDPQTERLYVGGAERDEDNLKAPWRMVLDRDGMEWLSVRGPVGPASEVVDVALFPAGGFVEITRLDVRTIRCE